MPAIPSFVKSLVVAYLKDQLKDFQTYAQVRRSKPVADLYPFAMGDLGKEFLRAALFVCTHGTPTEAAVIAFLGKQK